MAMKREEIIKGIAASDLDFEEGNRDWEAALVLLSAVEIGCDDLQKLAEFSGVDLETIKEFEPRLRKAGVWREDGKTACEWFEEGGALALILDSMVALGLMERRPAQ